MRIDLRILDRIAPLAFLAYVAVITGYAWLTPHYNWDMIAYIACALEASEPEPAALHAKTFETVRNAVPPARYEALTNGPYYGATAHDPESFYQQLPRYRVKPLYIWLMRALGATGLSLVTATRVISVAGAGVLAFLTYTWLALHFRPSASAVLGALILNTSGLLILTKVSTPDGLSALITLLGLFLLVEKQRPALALFVLGAAILARYENLILVGMVGLYLIGIRGRRNPRAAVGYLAALASFAVVYLIIARTAGKCPWATLFVHAFVGPIDRPAEFTGGVSLGVYVPALLRGFRDLLEPQPSFILFAGWMAYVSGAHMFPEEPLRRHVLVLLLAVTAIRMLLFPFLLARYLFPFYVTAGVSLAITSSALRSSALRRDGLTARDRGKP